MGLSIFLKSDQTMGCTTVTSSEFYKKRTKLDARIQRKMSGNKILLCTVLPVSSV